jgi:hypothetical protein
MAEELLMEEMIKAADIFKDNPPAREVFLSFTSDQFRLGWLRKQLLASIRLAFVTCVQVRMFIL